MIDPAHPRHDLAEIKTDDKLRAHPDFALETLHDPHDVRLGASRRHELDRTHTALVRLEDRLQHERVMPIPPRRAAHPSRGTEQPPSMLGSAQKRREASAGIKPRKAAPVDRPHSTDQRRRVQIAKQRIVLDPRRGTNCAHPYTTPDRSVVIPACSLNFLPSAIG